MRAETLGMYSVDSNARGVLYVYNKGEYAICTRYGVLRLTEHQAEAVAEELADIIADIKGLRRLGARS